MAALSGLRRLRHLTLGLHMGSLEAQYAPVMQALAARLPAGCMVEAEESDDWVLHLLG